MTPEEQLQRAILEGVLSLVFDGFRLPLFATTRDGSGRFLSQRYDEAGGVEFIERVGPDLRPPFTLSILDAAGRTTSRQLSIEEPLP